MPKPNPDNWRGIQIGGPHHCCQSPDAQIQKIGQQNAPLTLSAILQTPPQSTIATNDSTAERFTAQEIGPRWLLVLQLNSPKIIQGEGALDFQLPTPDTSD
jgi:hypothetical protein